MIKKHCKWCDTNFDASVSYQIYCSVNCRESATRENIASRYLINKRKKSAKKPKLCKSCGIILSVYNDYDICQSCQINPIDVKKELKDIKRLIKDED